MAGASFLADAVLTTVLTTLLGPGAGLAAALTAGAVLGAMLTGDLPLAGSGALGTSARLTESAALTVNATLLVAALLIRTLPAREKSHPPGGTLQPGGTNQPPGTNQATSTNQPAGTNQATGTNQLNGTGRRATGTSQLSTNQAGLNQAGTNQTATGRAPTNQTTTRRAGTNQIGTNRTGTNRLSGTGRQFGGAGREPRPTEIALLRQGPSAAVVTALVLLHARGAVDSAAPGTVRRSGDLPRGCDPLARVVYDCLDRPGSPAELTVRAPVRAGLDTLSTGLAGAGLMVPARRRLTLWLVAVAAALTAAAGAAGEPGSVTVLALVLLAGLSSATALLSGHTAGGRRLVRELHRRHADLRPEHGPDAAEWSPQFLGLAVALHGAAALRLTFPRFGEQGGLFGVLRPEPGWTRTISVVAPELAALSLSDGPAGPITH